MNLSEDFMSNLKSAIPKQMSSAGVFNSGVEGGNIEAMKSINTYNRELSEEPNNGETDEGNEDRYRRNVYLSAIL